MTTFPSRRRALLIKNVWAKKELMLRRAVTSMAILLALSGCQSRAPMDAHGLMPNTPVVTLESTTVLPESPGQAYPSAAMPMPLFPFQLVRAGIAGEVEVKLAIDRDGFVTEATVLRSSQKDFEAPTLVAVRQWRFVEAVLPDAKAKSGAIVKCRIKFAFDES